jgi:dTDP-4-dehydrorhamnose 3,5-epimerase
MLYIPEGVAHGFQTLEDHAEVFYQMSEFHAPDAVGGVRWNDPVFAIRWPDAANRIISARDQSWPPFSPERPANAAERSHVGRL